MIEIMFGESEGGAMKMAKNYKKPDFHKSAIGWIGKKPSKEEFDKIFDGKTFVYGIVMHPILYVDFIMYVIF